MAHKYSHNGGWGSFKSGKGTCLRQDKRRKTGGARTPKQIAASNRRKKR